jgi:hypothetical protein
MTRKEAYRILGLSQGSGWDEIKRKYRKLMMQVHPDSGIDAASGFAYSAQELNLAYEFLKKEANTSLNTGYDDGDSHADSVQARASTAANWNAPMNPGAYMEREILHYVEDYDGTVIGNICVAKGKYLWTTEEDFPLFLLSLYRLSKQILDELDSTHFYGTSPANRHQIQTELTYLLAQQFISGTELLRELAKEETVDSDGNRIFRVASMLESSGPRVMLKPRELLYPSRICSHRLYLCNHGREEVGYLSFPDDRLYYVVIPLFEQKAVQIRIQAAGQQPGKPKNARTSYQHLHLWLRFHDQNRSRMPENLNLQIERLLQKYMP